MSGEMKTEVNGSEQASKNNRVLIMTSVEAEREAVLRGLNHDDRFDVCVAGVGSVAAAISTTKQLAKASYGLVVNAGIAGGFEGQAEIGSIVVASAILAADLGAETPDGFLSVEELGFGSSRISVEAGLAAQVTEAIRAAGHAVSLGPVITCTTVTGTAATAEALSHRVPGAVAEAMEGYGIGTAAASYGLPVLEIRAISNAVGPRNRAAWRIKEALNALEAASAVFVEVL